MVERRSKTRRRKPDKARLEIGYRGLRRTWKAPPRRRFSLHPIELGNARPRIPPRHSSTGIRETPNLPQPKRKQDPTADLREEITELNKKKKRWLDLYEEEKLDPQTLTERIQRLDDQLNEANAKLTKQRASQARHESNRTTRTRLAQLLDNLEGYYLQAPPAQVNADLHNIIERVVITKDQKIKIHWRGED